MRGENADFIKDVAADVTLCGRRRKFNFKNVTSILMGLTIFEKSRHRRIALLPWLAQRRRGILTKAVLLRFVFGWEKLWKNFVKN
jgi:hypothetical protein